MPNRVLIIGLDGSTWTVLSPWIEDGSLPNLARLRAEGTWGELRSTIPPLTAPAWSSFLTGKNPGKHGVFHFIPLDDAATSSQADAVQPANGSANGDREEIVDSRSIQSATLWDILGHHQRRIGAINVPMSYPPRPVNGFMVTCLLTPPHASVFTYPPELSQKLTDYQIDLDRFIDQKPFARDLDGERTKRIVKPDLQLVQEFYEMEEKRSRAALKLMSTQDWDSFMVVFTATDRMGHYLWPYHQPQGENAPKEAQMLHQAIHAFYVRLDEHIGELVEMAGKDTAVIVMSDHGMGPIYSKKTHWNNWLYKNGYLTYDRRSGNTIDAWLLRLGLPKDKIRKMLQRVPRLFSSRVVQKAKKAPAARIDYTKALAYYTKIFDPVGGIRINAKGQRRDQIRDELIGKLREVTDPATGKCIVREIYRREDFYTGPHTDRLPDIILMMHPEYGSSDRLSNYSAVVTDRPEIDDPGGHHIEGIFIGSGPGIRKQVEPIPELSIIDLAPTILYLMGLPVPADMDGRVIVEMMDSEALQNRPIVIGQEHGRWPSEEKAISILEEPPGDEKIIYDRLRALGYMK